MVVREPDGVLRFATPEEHDRALHVYFPRPGKMYAMPKMFDEHRLEVCHISLSLIMSLFCLNCTGFMGDFWLFYISEFSGCFAKSWISPLIFQVMESLSLVLESFRN